ncbi:hypothetical protein QN386_21320 [Pseudomonas sp. CCI3.2]|uniref:hypothetical protein n=1 Tax=unclassified Pseudomonas TaxID=196821 RepID=UPI002AC8C34B|nr:MULTISPECIES: hypothetical protein [unclassified Pseudomonas]MEB0075580.1 hypothetical protein [Pseudomonas sp. MH10out]MEB0103846.1 hypothetical protein [Pseudomonas sp. CCI3.2]MEB0130385.1 hypothetical protein [Pseudomonas sp. CCI2.4]MEB0159409.1 hypothetical protein [Pseudomonas sp. AH2 (2023)]MEB0170155.1 hypothetical protein [Pseudomonas sp. CCC4.4]
MKTSSLIFGVAFSVLAASAFALPAVAENISATHSVQVAADGADHVGADHVGANRVAQDGADHVGANRTS